MTVTHSVQLLYLEQLPLFHTQVSQRTESVNLYPGSKIEINVCEEEGFQANAFPTRGVSIYDTTVEEWKGIHMPR